MSPGAATKEQKRAAYLAVNRALRAGVLIRPRTCPSCKHQTYGGTVRRTIAAHHEDYSRPLDVVWLCGACHIKLHMNERKASGRPVSRLTNEQRRQRTSETESA